MAEETLIRNDKTRPAAVQLLLSIATACIVTVLYISVLSAGTRPVLATAREKPQRQEEEPRALFVVNAPATAPAAPVAAAAPAPAPVLTLSEKVVNALRAAGHYGAISGVLEGLPDMDQVIQPGTTFFAPDDAVSAGLPYNSSTDMMRLLNYHTANRAYAFQELLSLKVGDRIATVMAGISILVQNVAQDDYQLDNAVIVNADLYNNDSVAVHGINAVFFTQFYNTATLGPVPAPPPASTAAPGGAGGAGAASSPAAANSSSSSSSTSPAANSHKTSPNAACLTRASSSFTTCCVLTLQLLIFALILVLPL